MIETDALDPPDVAAFEAFIATTGRRLQAVLVAQYGRDLGVESAADALAYAWEHWPRVSQMANPLGYLYRVGQTAAGRHLRRRRHPVLPPVPPVLQPDVDPRLPEALAALSSRQRTAVVLVHAYGWSQTDAAAALECSVSTLRNHLARGLTRLRRRLETNDA